MERAVHDELAERCLRAVERIPELWRENKRRMFPTLMLWPEEPLTLRTGETFSGAIYCVLPEDPALRRKEIASIAKKYKAYGLLLTEQIEGYVRLVFESEHGTRTWRFPIKNHGGVQVLGRPERRDNAESIGIRWRAN